jgi:uncharacterized membrane protein YccC
MDRAHTKGPWRVSRLTETTVENSHGRGVCSTGGYQQNFDTERVYQENRANARLIAAAPDMYEALKAVLPVLEAVQRQYAQMAKGRGMGGDGPVLEATRLALAKAEGRANRADAAPNPPSMEGR